MNIKGVLKHGIVKDLEWKVVYKVVFSNANERRGSECKSPRVVVFRQGPIYEVGTTAKRKNLVC